MYTIVDVDVILLGFSWSSPTATSEQPRVACTLVDRRNGLHRLKYDGLLGYRCTKAGLIFSSATKVPVLELHCSNVRAEGLEWSKRRPVAGSRRGTV